MNFTFQDFKAVVLESVSPSLKSNGYHHFEEDTRGSPEDISVFFRKIQDSGLLFQLSYQLVPRLLPDYSVEQSAFKINFYRKRMNGYQGDPLKYRNLLIGLRNVLEGVYRITVFSEGIYDWQFDNEESLREQLDNAQHLLLEYGLRWFEDTNSTMDWTYFKSTW